jgi:hypothetical protein
VGENQGRVPNGSRGRVTRGKLEVSKLKPNAFIWVQRDGTPIWIKDMTDTHLQLTVRMIRRRAAKIARTISDDPHDPEFFDDGSYPFVISADELLDNKPYFHTMLLEMRRRGIHELPEEGK